MMQIKLIGLVAVLVAVVAQNACGQNQSSDSNAPGLGAPGPGNQNQNRDSTRLASDLSRQNSISSNDDQIETRDRDLSDNRRTTNDLASDNNGRQQQQQQQQSPQLPGDIQGIISTMQQQIQSLQQQLAQQMQAGPQQQFQGGRFPPMNPWNMMPPPPPPHQRGGEGGRRGGPPGPPPMFPQMFGGGQQFGGQQNGSGFPQLPFLGNLFQQGGGQQQRPQSESMLNAQQSGIFGSMGSRMDSILGLGRRAVSPTNMQAPQQQAAASVSA